MDIYCNMLCMMNQYSIRMHDGPPLQEHEALCYQQLCRNIEVLARSLRLHLSKDPILGKDDYQGI